MPRESYEELLTPLTEGAVVDMENKDVEYDGKNMEAVVVLLEFLSKRLDMVCVRKVFQIIRKFFSGGKEDAALGKLLKMLSFFENSLTSAQVRSEGGPDASSPLPVWSLPSK